MHCQSYGIVRNPLESLWNRLKINKKLRIMSPAAEKQHISTNLATGPEKSWKKWARARPRPKSTKKALSFETCRNNLQICVPPRKNDTFWRAKNAIKLDGNAWKSNFATPLEENHLPPNPLWKKRVLVRTPGEKPAAPTGKMLPTEGNKHFLTDQ